MTEKRNGDTKARKVADGSKQRTYDDYDKSDGSSPTVVTESIFMTGVVDAKERRNVAVLDIANAFLQADNDETVNMLLTRIQPLAQIRHILSRFSISK